MTPAASLIWIALAYLCGSIPFALLIGWAHGIDVRKAGSGNVGATNVNRLLGRKWGVLCFLLDVLKGLAPVLAAGIWAGLLNQRELDAAIAWRWLAIGAAAVLGHVFPIWLRFRGGKGVATALGVLMAYWPTLTLPGCLAAATWFITVKTTRYVSLASIVAAVTLPIYLLLLTLAIAKPLPAVTPFLVVSAALALLVVLRHRGNLARLRAGTEPRIGQRAPARDSAGTP